MSTDNSAVSAVEAFILSEARVASEDVIGLLAARLGLSRGDASRAVSVLIQAKKLFYRRSGGSKRGEIVEVWRPWSRADRLDMSVQAKREGRYAKGVPSVTYGGEVTSRHVKFDPRANGALSVLNECLGALIDKAGKSGRVKNPEKIIAAATRQREFRFTEARCILAVLQELGVVEHLRSSHLGCGGVYTLALGAERRITEAAYQAWLEGKSSLDEPYTAGESESMSEAELSPHTAALQGRMASAVQMAEALQQSLDALRADLEIYLSRERASLATGYVAGAQYRLKAVQDSLDAASEMLDD